MKDEKQLDPIEPDDGPSIFDDLEKLKTNSAIPPEPDGAKKAPSPRLRWKRYGTFLPREWELRLKKATRVSTYHLALELLYRHWRDGQGKFGHKEGPVVVSGEVLEAAGISKRSMVNVLDDLERLGLISIIRTKRRSPRAFPLHIPPRFWR